MASLLQHKEWQVTKNTKTHVHPINILSPTDQGEPEVPGAPEDENKEDIDGEIQSKSSQWNLISICMYSIQLARLGTIGRVQRTSKPVTIKDSKYVQRGRMWIHDV